MKFLVTGSAGLVGSQIVKDLILQNHQVYSCYNDSNPLGHIVTLACLQLGVVVLVQYELEV